MDNKLTTHIVLRDGDNNLLFDGKEFTPEELARNLIDAAVKIERLQAELKEKQIDSILNNSKLKMLEALQPQWVSVEDRLPEEFGRYLIYFDADFTTSDISTAEWLLVWVIPDDDIKVTHWQPLPTPPPIT